MNEYQQLRLNQSLTFFWVFQKEILSYYDVCDCQKEKKKVALKEVDNLFRENKY